MVFALVAVISAVAATSVDASFADVPTGREALAPNPFPDRMSAYVWRNWGMVPLGRLAAVVGATEEDLVAVAAEMGLAATPDVLSEWRRKGYITLVRRNWHLLTCEQISCLVDMSAEEFAFSLKEDDFLLAKLGGFKPSCPPLRWDAEGAASGRAARLQIARILEAERVDPNAEEEPRFKFVKDLGDSSALPLRPSSSAGTSPFSFRMISSYFADYGDPLANEEVPSYPEGLLQRLSASGVNAIWMHVVLNQLTTDPKYPEFGKGSNRRKENLRKLVGRAAKHGIKVYLYLNEPRCVRDVFFADDAREEIRGVTSAGMTAMCTSASETRRWLKDALRQLFSEVKGLGGAFTITMSENLTNCASLRKRMDCPRCRERTVADIVAEVNATIVDGVLAGDPSAEVIIWNWSWPRDDECAILGRLPKKGCRVMAVSEDGIPVTVGGVTVPVKDYSIASVGPGKNACGFWNAARANGFSCVAKVQANCTWELASFPYLPLADLVAEHVDNLKSQGVDGVMLSWSCGAAPAPNLRLFDGFTLDALAADLYGERAVSAVRRAWKAFANGYRQYPFDVVGAYKGPQQWGPVNPLYSKPTGFQATMVGIPYDGLDFGTWDNKWHGRFPVDAWIESFEQVAIGFEKGCRLFAMAIPEMDACKRADAEKELRMFRAEAMHFRSVVNQSRFILARDAGDKVKMREWAQRELDAAKAYLPLVRGDSRIGYECSNHYFYTPRDVVEKIIGCRKILDELNSRDR